jgi:hypothetical protein
VGAGVRGLGMLEKFFLNGVLVEFSDGAQPLGDGGAGTAFGLQFAGEGLDVGAADREQGQRTGAAPVNWRRSSV